MRSPEQIILPAAAAIMLTAAAFVSFARGEEAAAGELAVVSAWARATPPGADVGAAYVAIENNGAADDRIVDVSTPGASAVSMHTTIKENGVATMRPLDDPTVPAGGTLDMQPGGVHLMLMDLTAPLVEGDTLPLTLAFENAGAVSVDVTIGMGADGPAEHDSMQ